MTMTAVTFAATIDRVLNGLTRPFFGWISDMIGRENTMFIAFGMEGVGIWALYMLRPRSGLVRDPFGLRVLRLGRDLFAVPVDLHRYVRREIRHHQCRPALYGQRAPRRLLVPVANYMQQSSGNWDRVFIIAAGANILASLLAIAVLKPWRKTRGRQGAGDSDRLRTIICEGALIPCGWRALFVRRDACSVAYLTAVRIDVFATRLAAASRATRNTQNVSIAAFFVACRVRITERDFALTIGIMYTNLAHEHDVELILKEVAMQVGDILRKKTARVATVRMNETVAIAAQLMRASNISALVVKDVVRTEGNTAVGMFTERDVVRAIAEHGAAGVNLKVSQLISVQQLVSCSFDRYARTRSSPR